jgi:hypothetical protein
MQTRPAEVGIAEEEEVITEAVVAMFHVAVEAVHAAEVLIQVAVVVIAADSFPCLSFLLTPKII